jgi:hypothetical protein
MLTKRYQRNDFLYATPAQDTITMTRTAFFLTASLLLLASVAASAADGIARAPKGSPDLLCTSAFETKGISDLNKAFGGLWLNRDLETSNALLRTAYQAILGDEPKMTPEIADEKAKWQMRTWVRIYCLFSSKSAWRPGRLDAENERCIEDLLWNYALAKSSVKRAQPEYIWFIQGSENHDAMDLVNAFLAVQALSTRPEYTKRTLADGHNLREHCEAWTAYYKLYCEERIKYGLFIEIASPTYGKYMIPELTNIADFAADPGLRARMTALLDVAWADWAIEQLNTVRGGAKTRCYQDGYSRRGDKDSWRKMGQLLLNQGNWADARVGGHPIHGFNLILSTSTYRLPQLVADLARKPDARGEYVYISRRPGKMTMIDELPPLGGHPCYYHMDNLDSRLVRYTWCTPNHIMGSFRVDPHLGESTTIRFDKKEKTETSYAAISGQNRWQGIIFDTGVDARVFPQCVGHSSANGEHKSVTEIQQVALQHENVLIVQANRADRHNQAMRVYFAPGMKKRLREDSGWLVLEEGDSYLAVRPMARRDGNTVCGYTWDDENMLRLDDLYVPVIFVTGRRAHHASVDAFIGYIGRHGCTMKDGILTYAFTDGEGSKTQLTLFAEEQRLPEINGKPLDLAPAKTYDSPYLSTDFGSPKVTITFGEDTVEIGL